MPAPSPDALYVALLEKSVAWLAAAIVVIGGSFSAALVYIYKQGQGTIVTALQSMDVRIGEVADNLGKLTDKLFDKTDDLTKRSAVHEARIEKVEALCAERHGGSSTRARNREVQ